MPIVGKPRVARQFSEPMPKKYSAESKPFFCARIASSTATKLTDDSWTMPWTMPRYVSPGSAW